MGVVLFNLVALGIETGTSGAVDRSSISTLLAARKRILTGIRPTGPLHLGRYAGALENWLKLQDEYDGYFLIADYQVADHAHDLPRLRNAVWEVALDWLAVGLDPERASFVIEGEVPEHTELTTWLAWSCRSACSREIRRSRPKWKRSRPLTMRRRKGARFRPCSTSIR